MRTRFTVATLAALGTLTTGGLSIAVTLAVTDRATWPSWLRPFHRYGWWSVGVVLFAAVVVAAWHSARRSSRRDGSPSLGMKAEDSVAVGGRDVIITGRSGPTAGRDVHAVTGSSAPTAGRDIITAINLTGPAGLPAFDPSTAGRLGPPVEAAGPGRDHRSLSSWHSYALVEPQELIHVDNLVDDLTRAVLSETTSSALTVSGVGGVGKTAITYAAVERIAAASDFTHLVWASAKNTRFSAADVSGASVESIYWHDVVRMIGSQLECVLAPSQALWEQQLRAHIEHELDGARLLVVVDNLEVVRAADRVIQRLRELGVRRPHKILATTRWAVTQEDLDVRDLRVPPLGAEETYDLVRLVADGTGSDLATAADRELRPIYEITEGNPFLIKLITRRYVVTGRSLQRIIDELKTVSFGKLGKRVRAWLFDQSLDELRTRSSEDDAVRLLFSFCVSGRGNSMAYKELRDESSIVEDERFEAVLEAACRLGLVRPSDRNKRYSIHSLLYEYTCPLAWQLRTDN